jgi:hypothetical protein
MTYTYAGKVWTHVEVMALDNRQLRYRILHNDRVKQKNKNYYKSHKEIINKYNNDNKRFYKAIKELHMIEI